MELERVPSSCCEWYIAYPKQTCSEDSREGGSFCRGHTCGECLQRRTDTSKYCKRHKCAWYDCDKFAWCKYYCDQHKACRRPDCRNYQKDAGKSYCEKHVHCSTEGCGAKLDLDEEHISGSPYSKDVVYHLFCRDHRCNHTSCTDERSAGSQYCSNHTCVLASCLGDRCEGDTHYCAKHACSILGCSSHVDREGGSRCVEHQSLELQHERLRLENERLRLENKRLQLENERFQMETEGLGKIGRATGQSP